MVEIPHRLVGEDAGTGGIDARSDHLAGGDRVATGEMVGPRIYTTGPGVFSDEAVRDLDHARQIMARYAKYYDTKTLKM